MQRQLARKVADGDRKAENRSPVRPGRAASKSLHPILHLQQVAGNRAVGRFLQRFTASLDGDKVLIHPEKGDTDADLDRVLCPAIKDRKINRRKDIEVTECLPKASVKSMGLGPYNCADFVRLSLGEKPPEKKPLEWMLTPKLWEELLKKGYTIRGFGVVDEKGKVEPAEGNVSWKQLNPRMGDLVFMKGSVNLTSGKEPSAKGDNFTVTWDHVGIFIVRSREGFDFHFAKDGDENPVGIYHTGSKKEEVGTPGAYVKGAGTLAAYLAPPSAEKVEEKKTEEKKAEEKKTEQKKTEQKKTEQKKTVGAPKSPEEPSAKPNLQRKCACGGHAIADGVCSEFEQKKRFGLEAGNGSEDIYEQEADRIADQMWAAPAHDGVSGLPSPVQRFSEQLNGQMDAAPASVDAVLAGPGMPLEPALRKDMEQRFGHDFSGVRVHTGAQAAQSARAVDALAYTVERDIVFGAAQFAPETNGGRRLLAHELVHTIQQGSAPPVAADGLPEADTANETAMKPPGTGSLAAGASATHLAPAGLLVMRQPAPTPATPMPCTMNCIDPAFLALSPVDREAQLNTQCPQGFTSTANTFFGQPIPAVSKTLLNKLLNAQSLAKRAFCLDGRDPDTTFVLTRSIITYAAHSPAMKKAVDIDLKGQPYIMHEKGEAGIDKDVGEVYERIAFWAHYAKSIIPSGITSVRTVAGGTGTERTWTNPRTGAKKEQITTGELYDLLSKESSWMREYFNLLLKSDRQLTHEVEALLVFNTDPLAPLTKLKLPIDESAASVQAFRQRIADDYRLLGGSAAQLEAFAGTTIAAASKTPLSPTGGTGDRPFEGGVPAGTTLHGGAQDPAQNRRPELGFISLPKEVVVALTEVGLIWGAIDFAGESGDVMHFDCRLLPGC